MAKRKSRQPPNGKSARHPPKAPSTAIIRANVNREIVESPAFVSLYANDTQIQLSAWDVRMIFGVISEPATNERPTIIVKTVGEVRMSPQHAKKIAMILINQLRNYETSVGVIPLVPD